MNWLEAIILGVIQGITEFLPISSSGHLEIAHRLWKSNDIGETHMFFTIVVHFATALATLFVFRKDVLDLIKGISIFKKSEQRDFIIKIIISMIPAVLVGFLLEDFIKSFFSANTTFIGINLIITAIILYLSDYSKKVKQNKVSHLSAFIIGIVQAIAILPGISRSGSTISMATILGIERSKATRFSFFMVIPLIFGGIAKTLLLDDINFNISTEAFLCGGISAFIFGIIACKTMIFLVKQSKLVYFSIYCLIVGILSFFI